MKTVTLLDVAKTRGIKESPDGGYPMGEFERVGIPMLGGCSVCGASVAAYNACPSTNGYIKCASGCIGYSGFPSVKAFEAFCLYQDAMNEAENEEEIPETLREYNIPDFIGLRKK